MLMTQVCLIDPLRYHSGMLYGITKSHSYQLIMGISFVQSCGNEGCLVGLTSKVSHITQNSESSDINSELQIYTYIPVSNVGGAKSHGY